MQHRGAARERRPSCVAWEGQLPKETHPGTVPPLMLERIADLTWRRPEARCSRWSAPSWWSPACSGTTSSTTSRRRASPTARRRASARRSCCASALGYDANPGIVLLVRARDGGRLDVRSARRAAARCAAWPATLRRHRVRRQRGQPAARPAPGAALIARDGRSLVISATSRRRTSRTRAATRPRTPSGGSAREHRSTSRMGGFAPELQRGQRPDAQGPDQGRADRLPARWRCCCCSSSAAWSRPRSRC